MVLMGCSFRETGAMRHRSGRFLRIATIAMSIGIMVREQHHFPDSGGTDADGADVPWLDDEEMAAWRRYAETVVDLNAALEADLAPHGLTLGDYQVLVYLSEADDRAMRMCDLAGALQLSPSGLTRRLDGLVKAGRGRAPAVRPGPAGDARRAHRRRVCATSRRSPRPRAPACAGTSSTSSTGADIAAMARIFGAIRDGLAVDRARGRMTALPRGFRCHVANVGVKDDTDDFVVDRRRPAGAPRPACSPGAASPGRASRQPRSTSPTGGAQAVVVVSKNANVATGPTAGPTPMRVVAGRRRRARLRRRRRARRLDRRDRPRATRWTRSAPASRAIPSPLAADRCRRPSAAAS